MLSDTEKSALANIRYFIDLIASFLKGYDYQHFAADLRTLHAVTRCLEIISEASRRVPEDIKARVSRDAVAADGRRRQQVPARI
jgi:uncharacterized protein with HEPN domain